MSKEIYTSNYNRCGNNPNAAAISASVPHYYKGNHFKLLAPSWDILEPYKNKQIDQHEYAVRYLHLLKNTRGLTPKEVYDAIPHGTILLCYEKPGDFCHRRILATWLEMELGVKIPEWESEEEINKRTLVDELLVF